MQITKKGLFLLEEEIDRIISWSFETFISFSFNYTEGMSDFTYRELIERMLTQRFKIVEAVDCEKLDDIIMEDLFTFRVYNSKNNRNKNPADYHYNPGECNIMEDYKRLLSCEFCAKRKACEV